MSVQPSPSSGAKKMKQARLPFAPLQKKDASAEDATRKRKLSDASQQNKDKVTKTDAVYEEVGAEYGKEYEAAKKPSSTDEEQKENAKNRPKKAKLDPDPVIDVDDDSQPARPDSVSGKIKLPFKLNKKKRAPSQDEDDDVDLEESLGGDVVMVDENEAENTSKSKVVEVQAAKAKTKEVEVKGDAALKEDEEASKTKPLKEKKVKAKKGSGGAGKERKLEVEGAEEVSMTEEWAQFHEKELEKNPVEAPDCEIVRLCTPKEKKSPKEDTSATPDKSKDSSAGGKPAESPKPGTSDSCGSSPVTPKLPSKSPSSATSKSASKGKAANPLSKFLVKMKPGEGTRTFKPKENIPTAKVEKPMTEENSDDSDEVQVLDDAEPEVVEEVDAGKQEDNKEEAPTKAEEKSSASTPVQLKAISKISTPGLVKTPSTGTPASVRAKQMAVTKLKVKIQEINFEMEEAVKQADFLKAHELKTKIGNLESECKTIEASAEFVSYSPASSIVKETYTIPDASTLNYNSSSSTKKPALESSTSPSAASASPGSGTPASAKSTKKKVMTPGSASGSPALPKALTPKQLALQEERRKKAVKAKEEAERKKAEKAAQQAQIKQDKERDKEIEKRRKEIERLEKDRIRREKEREKEKEKKEKEEERLRKKAEKEAEAKKKEEEKQRAEEARQKFEEAEAEKKKRAAEAFKGFFVKKDALKKEVAEEEKVEEEVGSLSTTFNPFQVKKNMRLAPLVRNDTAAAKRRIDTLEGPEGPDGLYLQLLKSKSHTPGQQGRTWPWQRSAPDIEVIEEEEEEEEEDLESQDEGVMILPNDPDKPKRAKLLQFHENQRPAYWGTWTKKSNVVSGRRPFGQDKERFDYEYDSDDDWEDEGEGESLSDADDDKEEEDDYEVDNEFFVPHGYLSDEEEGKDEDEVFNPEKEKEKLKLKEKEFQAECKKQTQHLKPRLWGCYFESEEELDTGAAASQLVKILSGYAAIPCCNNNFPIPTGISHPSAANTPSIGEEGSASTKVKKKAKVASTFPEEALPDLVRLVHVNSNNKFFLAKEFIQFWSGKAGGESMPAAMDEGEGGAPTTPSGQTPGGSGPVLSKRKVVDKIQEIANYKGLQGRIGRFWVVKPDILQQVGMSAVDSNTANTWTYILEQPNAKTPITSVPVTEEVSGSRPGSPIQAKNSSPNPASLITKFTKVLTEEERAKLTATPPSAKRAKLATQPSSTAAAGGVAVSAKNKLPTANVAAAGSPKPANGGVAKKKVNLIAVKKTSSGGSSAAASIKKFANLTPQPIQIRKTPKPLTNNGGVSSKAMAQLSHLSGLTVTKSGAQTAAAAGPDKAAASTPEDNCITID